MLVFVAFLLYPLLLGSLLQKLNFSLNAETIGLVSGVLLSLLFSYVPGFATWYNQKSTADKQLTMLGLLFLTSAAIFGLGCAGVLGGVACTKDGLVDIVIAFVLSLVSNQSVHAISPKVGLKKTSVAEPEAPPPVPDATP
jgi:hypothetical protein